MERYSNAAVIVPLHSTAIQSCPPLSLDPR
jgi:hypothetical protein